jgi:hypothetical protein
MPANLMLSHLADALGSLTRHSLDSLLGVAAKSPGAAFLRGSLGCDCTGLLSAPRFVRASTRRTE